MRVCSFHCLPTVTGTRKQRNTSPPTESLTLAKSALNWSHPNLARFAICWGPHSYGGAQAAEDGHDDDSRNMSLLVSLLDMEVSIESSWKEKLQDEFEKSYFAELARFVKDEYKSTAVYPPPQFLFRAFELTPFDKVKVVILGQDPYHGQGQANGLCFAVNDGVKLPPSLQNIYKELASDIEMNDIVCRSLNGDLSGWARQGVLLLNATLTVRAATAGSHQNKGWEEFTDAVIRALSEKRKHLVFILWGNYARAKGASIDRTKHFVIESPHPSPFSAYNGFFGSKPFSKTNAYFLEQGVPPIDWLS